MSTPEPASEGPPIGPEEIDRFDEEGLDETSFDRRARAVFVYQYAENPVYRRYCRAIDGHGAESWTGWTDAPFLPVEAFKHAPVTTFPPEEAERTFTSSGTGSGTPSRHFVRDLTLYDRSVLAGFTRVFGTGPSTLLAHLPSYNERGKRSSLLHMAELLVNRLGNDASGFFLDDRSTLTRTVEAERTGERPFVLLGAAFGLLDLLEEEPVGLPENARVIETGGMKTHRRSIGRSELHDLLARGFDVPRTRIYSEYGMCELLSQCYTRGDRVFRPPPWMRLRVVDPENPRRGRPPGSSGALAVFDLANVHTVSALLTGDRAVRRREGVEILGRLPASELRGCNFLFED